MRQPPEPKPFFWISPKEEPRRDFPPGHDRFTGDSGRLDLRLQVVSDYLYVGGGQFELKTIGGRQQAYYAFARRDGQLVIPGSSLKGAVRSVLEAISPSCVKVVARDIREGNQIIKPDERRLFDAQGLFRQWRSCDKPNQLCPACRLFGAVRYAGRIHFSEGVLEEQIETTVLRIGDLWPPRKVSQDVLRRKFFTSGGMRHTEPEQPRNYRFIEAVPKDSRFTVSLYFENVRPAEMGLVLRSMGLDLGAGGRVVQAFPIKVGGAKPRCLGAVRFEVVALWLVRNGPGLLAALAGGGGTADLVETLREWLSAPTEGLLDRQAWEQFRHNAAQQDAWCPKELY